MASLMAGAVWAGQPATLKYGWERGRSYVYKVDIVAKHGEYTSSARGHTVYSVRAANLHGYTIRNHNFFSIQRHTTQGRLFPPFGIFKIGWRHFDGASVGRKLRPHFDAVIGRQGKWLASSGVDAPVRDLSSPATLVMEILPADSVDEWETETKVQVIHERREKKDGAGRLVKLVKTPLEATEKCVFSVTESRSKPNTRSNSLMIASLVELERVDLATVQVIAKAPGTSRSSLSRAKKSGRRGLSGVRDGAHTARHGSHRVMVRARHGCGLTGGRRVRGVPYRYT
mgnify:CR=1 FL=1